jgi:hypothetical protein
MASTALQMGGIKISWSSITINLHGINLKQIDTPTIKKPICYKPDTQTILNNMKCLGLI